MVLRQNSPYQVLIITQVNQVFANIEVNRQSSANPALISRIYLDLHSKLYIFLPVREAIQFSMKRFKTI